MNFEDESFVKVYKRQTLGTKLLGWDGRAVLRALFLLVDRAGVLDLDGMDPAEVVAALEEMPLETAAAGMAKLVARRTVVVTDGVLFIPNFLQAQDAKQSDAQRQRESRAARAAKTRATTLGLPVTFRDEPQTPRGTPPLETPSHTHPATVEVGESVTERDEKSPQASRVVTERSPNPTAGHSRSDQIKLEADQPPPKDLTRSAWEAPVLVVVPDGDRPVPCPPDLSVTPAQRSGLKVDIGINDYQIDLITVGYRANWAADESSQRTLVTWRKCLAKAICGEFSNAKRRPPRSADEPETDLQSRSRLRAGTRQPNTLDHSTDEAHLRAIGATEE